MQLCPFPSVIICARIANVYAFNTCTSTALDGRPLHHSSRSQLYHCVGVSSSSRPESLFSEVFYDKGRFTYNGYLLLHCFWCALTQLGLVRHFSESWGRGRQCAVIRTL
ncbi:hypothetical protein EV421DRAFT_1785212 [Armillaria borealis]|uniref:Uncharacterized protein n=1 Tax=Armillaria borealis TaxID=47425 RepID=A0AA39JSG9_9AGAR|nr:hypothetical protein EV421DRAFT_1785212 [Armillaria borealis]